MFLLLNHYNPLQCNINFKSMNLMNLKVENPFPYEEATQFNYAERAVQVLEKMMDEMEQNDPRLSLATKILHEHKIAKYA